VVPNIGDTIIVCREDEDYTNTFWINTTYNPVRADVGESNPTDYSFGPGSATGTFELAEWSETPTSSGLYLGSVNMGYYKAGSGAGWKTYMNWEGKFYLSGSGSHALTWDGSTLAVTGTITVGSTALTESNTLNTNTTAANVGLSNVDNDSTATIQAGTTAANVGLGNVDNLNSQGQAQAGLITGTTITGGGITLSSGGAIKGGQTGYDSGTGFFLGYSSGYKFSIGNASGNKLTWNGSALAITGDISGGTIDGAAITAGTINVPASSPKFSVNANGILTAVDGNFSGAITATSGAFTGNMTAGTNKWHLDGSGNMWWGAFGSYSAAALGDTTYITGDGRIRATNLAITGGEINIDAVFTVTSVGAITASAGTIGGWSISSTNLSKNTGTDEVRLDASQHIISARGGVAVLRGYSSGTDIRIGIAGDTAYEPSHNQTNDVAMTRESGVIKFSVEQALLVDDGAVTINNGLTLGTLSGGSSNKLYRSGSTLYWNGSAVGGVDWTVSQSANIHSGNYTNTTYTSSDFNHDSLTGFVTNEHIDWSASQSANIHSNNYTDTNTDTDTTYSASSPITLSGTTFGFAWPASTNMGVTNYTAVDGNAVSVLVKGTNNNNLGTMYWFNLSNLDFLTDVVANQGLMFESGTRNIAFNFTAVTSSGSIGVGDNVIYDSGIGIPAKTTIASAVSVGINSGLSVASSATWGGYVTYTSNSLRVYSSRGATKEHVTTILDADALSRIKALRPVNFYFNDKIEPDNEMARLQKQRGFIAEELAAVDHNYAAWGWLDADENPIGDPEAEDLTLDDAVPIGFQMHSILADAVAVLQELSNKLDAAEARIAVLETA
jgi:hypothetical protein